jgi:hypothetical protein
VGVAAISSADVGDIRGLVSEKRSVLLLNAYDDTMSSRSNVVVLGMCVACDAAVFIVDGSVSMQSAGGGGSREFHGKRRRTISEYPCRTRVTF